MCSIKLDAAPGRRRDSMLEGSWKVIHQETKYNNNKKFQICVEFNT